MKIAATNRSTKVRLWLLTMAVAIVQTTPLLAEQEKGVNASVAADISAVDEEISDPLESMNRGMFLSQLRAVITGCCPKWLRMASEIFLRTF
jgi:hypothetical protein